MLRRQARDRKSQGHANAAYFGGNTCTDRFRIPRSIDRSDARGIYSYDRIACAG